MKREAGFEPELLRREMGLPEPRDYHRRKVPVTFKTLEEHRRVKNMAKKKGTTASKYCRQAILERLARDEKESPHEM